MCMEKHEIQNYMNYVIMNYAIANVHSTERERE